jgi:hypothetical protein
MTGIKCQYLRIHITGIANPTSLETQQSGLIISDIYGSTPNPTSIFLFLESIIFLIYINLKIHFIQY